MWPDSRYLINALRESPKNMPVLLQRLSWQFNTEMVFIVCINFLNNTIHEHHHLDKISEVVLNRLFRWVYFTGTTALGIITGTIMLGIITLGIIMGVIR